MSDKYYLKKSFSNKTETFTYEYDEFKDFGAGGGSKYYLDIIFENDKFSRIEFNKQKSKIFENNLREKELELFESIKKEIRLIEERIEEEKWDILNIKLKSTEEQIELINSATSRETAKEALETSFPPIIKYFLDKLKLNKIPFEELSVPSLKLKVPLEYEIEIFNPKMKKNEDINESISCCGQEVCKEKA